MKKTHRMQKYSKILQVFALIMLLVSIISACSNENDPSDGDSDTIIDGDLDQEMAAEQEESGEMGEDSEQIEEDKDNEPVEIDPNLTVDDIILPAVEEISPDLPLGVRVRVATYNIYGGKFIDNYWEIGDFLKTLNLDLVGLEECPNEAVEEIATAGDFEYTYAGAGGKAMLSKTPLKDNETLYMAAGGRSVLHAVTEIDGVDISFYVAHLDWDTAGDVQCKALSDEYLKKDPYDRLILVGDFNDETYSKQIGYLNEAVTDAATVAGWFPGERISWPSFGFDDVEGSQLIDLIFFKKEFPAIVIEADVINQTIILSDHKPALAELMFPVKDAAAFSEDPYASYRDIWRDFPAEVDLPENLLLNPGAEDGLTGWEIYGDAKAEEERQQQTAHSGSKFFTGFIAAPNADTYQSSGSQIVDISDKKEIINQRRARMYASAYMATGYNLIDGKVGTETEGLVSNTPLPYDEGEIIIDCLDAEDNLLLRATSKRRDTLGYHPFAKVIDLPPYTEKVRYTWMSHFKHFNGEGNDAVFDDLYLGFEELDTPHSILDRNLVINSGAETGDINGWQSDSWRSLLDLKTYGLGVYASLSFSGKNYFYGGGEQYLSNGKEGVSEISQKIDLAQFKTEINSDSMALRWGGWFRALGGTVYLDGKNSNAVIKVNLEIYNNDESLWNTVESKTVSAAEWTKVENMTKIPAGTSAVRLVISSEVYPVSTGAFMDEVYVIPVHLEQEQ